MKLRSLIGVFYDIAIDLDSAICFYGLSGNNIGRVTTAVVLTERLWEHHMANASVSYANG